MNIVTYQVSVPHPTPLPEGEGALPCTAVIGAQGYLGAALYEALRNQDPRTIGTTRREGGAGFLFLDLANPSRKAIELSSHGVRAAIIAAALPGQRCDADPIGTRRVNVDGTISFAKELGESGILPVFLSTDYVFDGSRTRYCEEDVPLPATEYGRQKLEVEQALQSTREPFLIVRLSKVFGTAKGDGTLLDEMAQALIAGKTISAAFDQVLCPTLCDDVVRGVLALLQTGATGIFHLCAPEPWSRYDLARALAQRLQCPEYQIRRVSLDEVFPGSARPRCTAMTCRRFHDATGMKFTSLQECLDRVARNYRAAP